MAISSFNARVVITEEQWEEIKNSTPSVIFEKPKMGSEEVRQKMLENLKKYPKEVIFKIPPKNIFL